jgi:exonuclease SbcC
MKLKKIKINNLRSYKEQEIEFPEGSTLLSGDIGSGKTSILLAIEFALFGLQPGQKGSSLLRKGEKTGEVKLEFEINGEDYIIERKLKKNSKSVSQDYCAITINNETQESSVTELKSKVLKLLNYPPEFAKKQNLLYKFTVYAPQEEMKQIILQDSETRLNTLRHVFGIDKYKKILENSSKIASKLREEKRLYEGKVSNLDQNLKDLEEKKKQLVEKNNSLEESKLVFERRKKQRQEKETEKQEIEKKRQEKIKLEQESEKTKMMIANKQEKTKSNNEITSELEKRIQELKSLNFEEFKLPELEKKLLDLKKRKQELDEKNMGFSTKINSLTMKNQEGNDTKERLSHIEVCPTCLQDVDPVYKSNAVNKIDSDLFKNVKQIENIRIEKAQNQKQITKLESEITKTEKEIQEMNILKVKVERLEEQQEKLKELQKLNLSLNKDIDLLNKQLMKLREEILHYCKYDSLFNEKQKELNEALEIERKSEINVAELKKETGFISQQIQDLNETIKKTREFLKKLNYIADLESWITQKFIPIISNVERNVMLKLRSEFSNLFEEWFNMLVSDTFNVSLKDDFSPVIQQQDYEIEYSDLSGGERTAVALAYRLSLNQVINSLLGKINTRDLVILDEPTDGFSAQQLVKMRDVLQELNVSQLIIVSHEQKIEDFVENVIKFKKENNESMQIDSETI